MTNDGLNSFSQARTHPATESEVAEEAIRQKRGTALSQSEREQLILTCINALGSQMAELQKKFVWLDARNEARLATMLEKIETLPSRENMTNALQCVIEGHHKSLESVYGKLTLIDMKAEHLCRQKPRKASEQPKRRKGKRPARNKGNA